MSSNDLVHSCEPPHEFLCPECPLQSFGYKEAAEGATKVMKAELLNWRIGTAETELGIAINACRRSRQLQECDGGMLDRLGQVAISDGLVEYSGGNVPYHVDYESLHDRIPVPPNPAFSHVDSLLRHRINHSRGQLEAVPRQK